MRKCGIIKLNYRQALKETNKYFVTRKLQVFMTLEMIENVYQASMIQWAGTVEADQSVNSISKLLTFVLRNVNLETPNLGISCLNKCNSDVVQLTWVALQMTNASKPEDEDTHLICT